MKLNKIFNTLSIAAVALLATACNDTDAQYSIPKVGAPEFVSVSPNVESALIYGPKTIKVKFDRKIGFATQNTNKITLNGTPVNQAIVYGADSTLTITVNVDFNKSQNLIIPAGLITGTQGDVYNQELNFKWEIKDLGSNKATTMTQTLGWGWNLGNHFDTTAQAFEMGWGYWDRVATISSAPFETLAAAGAKSVRIPATWTAHMDDNNVISADYLNEVAAVVDKAIAAGLNVILNTHHDSFETSIAGDVRIGSYAERDSNLIVSVWKQIATRFADYSDKLIFETFNEIHNEDGNGNWVEGDEEQYKLLNKWNQYAVDAIRSTGGNNANRWIGVAGYQANIDLTIKYLKLPEDPADRIMVGVHCYDPYLLCQNPMDEKADTAKVNSWGHNRDPYHSVADANEDYIINQLYKLRTAYIENGIPCYLGEYGCVNQTTEKANAFRKYYMEYFCRSAWLAGIPVFIWDNNAKTAGKEAFGYIDHADGSWLNDSETLVPLMIKANTDADTSYWFDTVWNNSPAAE